MNIKMSIEKSRVKCSEALFEYMDFFYFFLFTFASGVNGDMWVRLGRLSGKPPLSAFPPTTREGSLLSLLIVVNFFRNAASYQQENITLVLTSTLIFLLA